MRTIDQIKNEAIAIAVASFKRSITITGVELGNLIAMTDHAQRSTIEGVPQLHSKLKAIVGKFADTIPIKLPAAEIIILTSLEG